MATKRKYFKLGSRASVFSDYKTGLKVTRNIPGSTTKLDSKVTKDAIGNGHLIEIDETEFNTMLSKVEPKEKELALKEQGLDGTASAPDEEGGGTPPPAPDEDDEVRAGLLERLKAIKVSASKKKELQNSPNEVIEKFLEENE